MVYKSRFKNIVYPAWRHAPRVARYRIVLAKNRKLVWTVVYPLGGEPSQPHHADLALALAVVLNRVIDGELTGVCHVCMRPVVQTGVRLTDYPVRVNASKAWYHGRAANRSVGNTAQPLHIHSLDVVGGAVAFHVGHDKDKPASACVARLLP
ncbi:hypothetical protein [Paraburkholderia tuberum]|uniref:Uncharacterized protein n=1 Tax=Paraburkholderia tuberum TaxID=157910 RepID=A0A1H1KF63_9BURK|nr:hypothetical protein [Paraburkholderia tuberum]SDR60924.1 hypothetical protein SAMN05445850_7444 [Paraburkholderia tuberum]